MMVKQTPQKPLSAQTQPFRHYLQETPEILGPTNINQMPMCRIQTIGLNIVLNSEQRQRFPRHRCHPPYLAI